VVGKTEAVIPSSGGGGGIYNTDPADPSSDIGYSNACCEQPGGFFNGLPLPPIYGGSGGGGGAVGAGGGTAGGGTTGSTGNRPFLTGDFGRQWEGGRGGVTCPVMQSGAGWSYC
jgi:hypothetical protein